MILSPELVRNSTSSQRLCHYRNATSQLQIVRVTEGDQTVWERVLFPGEWWLYEANSKQALQIQTKG
jgi:hypothetical protein